LVGERPIDQRKQPMVLPEADPNATATTSNEMSSRVRSSSRCSTTLSRSSCPTGRQRIGAVAFGSCMTQWQARQTRR
jgi:hypothetical protein